MASVKQIVVVRKRKDGKSKGVFVKKSKGVIVVKTDQNGNIVQVYRDKSGRYFRNSIGNKDDDRGGTGGR